MHELFHDGSRTQKRHPAERASRAQAVVKICTQRARLASEAEGLLAALLLGAAVGTPWDRAAGQETEPNALD